MRARDPKRLYAADAPGLPGAGVAYEPPRAPEVVAPHGDEPQAAAAILALINRGGGWAMATPIANLLLPDRGRRARRALAPRRAVRSPS